MLREQVGLRNEAVIDRETHDILRLSYKADAIPPGFPVWDTVHDRAFVWFIRPGPAGSG